MNPIAELQAETGGRPASNDDFIVLQDRDAMLGLPSLLAGMAPCVVSGCRLWQSGSQWNVGAGMVWDGSNLLPFTGRSNVALPAMFTPGAVVVVDERAYQSGTTKTTIKQQSMDLVAVDPAATSPLIINTLGVLTFWHRTQEKIHAVGDIKPTTNLIAAHYDPTGLGIVGTPAWGWGLCNGRDGRADMRGAFMMGNNPDRAGLSITAVGDTGGEENKILTIAQMPTHNHVASTGQFGYDQVLRKAPYGSNTTAASTDGSGNGGSEPDIVSSQMMQPAGGGQPFDNRPPFCALGMIQWVGY